MWKKNYMMLAKEKEGIFFMNGEKLNSYFLLIRMCGVCLKFHNNQFETKVPLDFFFS
jgi:hypothetical protein